MTKRDRRYSTARWQRLRDQVIRRDGRMCSVEGCTSDMSLPRMTQVDHIIEVKDGGGFWDPQNLRLVCKPHHDAKTMVVAADRPSVDRRGAGGRSFPRDGHWNDKPTGREWASSNGLGCGNVRCARCLKGGYRK